VQQYSTSSVRENRRFDYWRELVASQFADLDCIPLSRNSFHGCLVTKKVGSDGGLLCVRSTSQRIIQTLGRSGGRSQAQSQMVAGLHRIPLPSPYPYLLNHLTAGYARAEQNGYVQDLRPGQLFLSDPTSHMQVDLPGDFSILSVSLPCNLVDRYIASTSNLCGVPLLALRSGPARLCADMLQSLATHCEQMSDDEAEVSTEILVRVVA